MVGFFRKAIGSREAVDVVAEASYIERRPAPADRLRFVPCARCVNLARKDGHLLTASVAMKAAARAVRSRDGSRDGGGVEGEGGVELAGGAEGLTAGRVPTRCLFRLATPDQHLIGGIVGVSAARPTMSREILGPQACLKADGGAQI